MPTSHLSGFFILICQISFMTYSGGFPCAREIVLKRELVHFSDILHAMKAVLSYHHVCKKTKSSLIDTDYMLVIPFLVNVLSTTRPEQLVLETTLSVLIEEFLTFMTNRPVYMRESYVQVNKYQYLCFNPV